MSLTSWLLRTNRPTFAEPNSEYIISLRARNNIGAGVPVYENVRTRDEQVPEVSAPLIPPVGVKAIVLSNTTVVVYWTDTMLSASQVNHTTSCRLRFRSSSSVFADLPCSLNSFHPFLLKWEITVCWLFPLQITWNSRQLTLSQVCKIPCSTYPSLVSNIP